MARTGLLIAGLLVVLVAVILQPVPRTWLMNLGGRTEVGQPASRFFDIASWLRAQGKGQAKGKNKELVITTESLPAVILGLDYSMQLAAAGGKKPYAWVVIEGALPPGLTLSTAGLLSGRPLPEVGAEPTYWFTIEVTDSSGKKAKGKPQQ